MSAGAGPLTRGDFRKLYADRLPYIRELIGPEDWPEVDQQWNDLFNEISSDRMREEWIEYAGFGLFGQMDEEEAVPYDKMVQGPSISVNTILYGSGYQIGYLAAKHDLDGIIARNAPELGRSLRMSLQNIAALFWLNAFTTNVCADGLSLCNTAHTFIRGGGTFANRPSPETSLGQAALEAALIAFRRQKDLMGNPMPLPAQTLLIEPGLEPVAHELLKSEMRSDTTTHAMSFLYNTLTPKSWPFLAASPTAWFVLSPKQYRKTYWVWNIRPETSHGFDFDRATAKTKTLFAASQVAVDPRGVWGTTG